MGYDLQNQTQAERDADRIKLGVQFTDFDKVFQAKHIQHDFKLWTDSHEVRMAYFRMINPRQRENIQP